MALSTAGKVGVGVGSCLLLVLLLVIGRIMLAKNRKPRSGRVPKYPLLGGDQGVMYSTVNADPKYPFITRMLNRQTVSGTDHRYPTYGDGNYSYLYHPKSVGQTLNNIRAAETLDRKYTVSI